MGVYYFKIYLWREMKVKKAVSGGVLPSAQVSAWWDMNAERLEARDMCRGIARGPGWGGAGCATFSDEPADSCYCPAGR